MTQHSSESPQLPAALVERLLTYDRSKKSFLPRVSRQEKVLLAAVGVFIAAGVLAYFLRGNLQYRWIAIALAVLSQLLACSAIVVVPVLELIPFVRDPAGALMRPVRRHFDGDAREILALAQKYEQHELEYAHEVLARTAADFSERVALITGPRVGLGPALVVLYFFVADKVVALSYGSQWGIYLPIAIAAFLMAVVQVECQSLGRVALLAKQAAAWKQRGARALALR
jgi:hypothetical protein